MSDPWNEYNRTSDFYISIPQYERQNAYKEHKRSMVKALAGGEYLTLEGDREEMLKKPIHYYELMQTGIMEKFIA